METLQRGALGILYVGHSDVHQRIRADAARSSICSSHAAQVVDRLLKGLIFYKSL
jgi:hypothetical protein